MKTLFFTIALTLISTLGFTQDSGKTITVTVENFTSNDGIAMIALHSSDTFMKGQGIDNLESKIINGKATFTFENVASGEYALLVLHDENNNKRMDFEDNGMPKEDYGMSNNVRSFGPPQYEDAKFSLNNEDLKLSIRL